MSEHVEQTITLVQQQVSQMEAELAEKRRMVNSLCALIGRTPLYPDVTPVGGGARPIRSDQYYGQPLATAIRMVLARRKLLEQGPATVAEIYDSLIAGGFKFGARTEDYAKRGLYTALTKNTATFHKLPNGDYGLMEWYPDVKAARSTKVSNGAEVTVPENEDEAEAKEAAAEAAAESEAAEPAPKESAKAKR